MKIKRLFLTSTLVILTCIAKGQTLSVSCNAYNDNCGSSGSPNGFAVATVANGNAPFTYEWSTGAVHVSSYSKDTVFGLMLGAYTVTVTGGGSATGTASTNVYNSAMTLELWPNFVSLPCPGTSNGALILSTYDNCMPSPYTFYLHNNTTGQSWGPHSIGCTVIAPLCHGVDTFKNLPAGSYYATLTNAQGCTGTLTMTLPELSSPIFSASVTSSPACGSTASGKIITHVNWKPNLVTATNSAYGGPSQVYVSNTLSMSLYTSTGTFIATHNNWSDSVFTNISPGSYEIRIAFNGSLYSAQCMFTYPVTVGTGTIPSAMITPSGPTTFCSGGSVVLNAVVATNRTYQWKKGGNLISGATLSSYTATTGGNYRVIVTNTVTGCSKTTTNAIVVTVYSLPAATVTPQGPTTFCAGGSVVLAANTGAGLTYKWKKNNVYISGATQSSYTATTAGVYKTIVTKSNGCSKTSAAVTITVPCREGVPIAIGIDVNVFPNPNSGEFTIEFSNKPTSPIQIELIDELGKVVKSFETNDETVVIKESNLANGIYCLTVRNKDEVVVKKINVVK